MLASRVLPPILNRRSSSQDHTQRQTPLPSYHPNSHHLHPHSPPPSEHFVTVPPVATFFNIPRRYIRSNMQVGDQHHASSSSSSSSTQHSSESSMDQVRAMSPRSLRKSGRVHDLRSTSLSSSSGQYNVHNNDSLNPSSANSPPRASRKRFASYGGSGGDEPASVIEEDSPVETRPPASASSTGSSADLSGHVCLCQPEPKIPRPRNAFILYRQHHQHAIVARNPGLANPEISKIIGEQWKAESDESKKVWQDLAQEEKARHHEQYPDYRYQPRRLGKPGSLLLQTAGHTTVDKYRCPRCNGRSIKTPTSPFLSSSSSPSLTVPTPTLPPPNDSSGLTPTTRYLPMMSNIGLDSSAARRGGRGSIASHGGLAPSSLSNIPVSAAARDDGAMYMASPLTPGAKRRRYNDYPAPTLTVNASNGPVPRRNESHSHAPYYPQHRRESLPPIQVHAHTGHGTRRNSPPHSANMPPPLRTPRLPADAHNMNVRRVSVDLTPPVPSPSLSQGSHGDQSRSVEAMVMSVPYSVKIKVLGRITPPLKDPGPSSPGLRVRGAIVAVEGDDKKAVAELVDWLHAFLEKENEFHPRVVEPPKAPAGDAEEVAFEDYLDLVREWHGKSREMVRFITTPVVTSTCSTDKSTSHNTNANKADSPHSAHASNDIPNNISNDSTHNDVKKENASHDKDGDTSMSEPPSPSSPTSPSSFSPKPILLLPTYQLSASDTYASKIPIQDVYSPMDHWQWMATLWRGTVGPDLTIYIKNGDGKEGKDAGNGGKAVEVNEEGKFLTVIKEGDGGRGMFAATALRRVGFEVGEWVRGVGR